MDSELQYEVYEGGKSYVIFGNTYPWKEEIKNIGGKYNANLKVDGKAIKGFILKKSSENKQAIEKLIEKSGKNPKGKKSIEYKAQNTGVSHENFLALVSTVERLMTIMVNNKLLTDDDPAFKKLKKFKESDEPTDKKSADKKTVEKKSAEDKPNTKPIEKKSAEKKSTEKKKVESESDNDSDEDYVPKKRLLK